MTIEERSVTLQKQIRKTTTLSRKKDAKRIFQERKTGVYKSMKPELDYLCTALKETGLLILNSQDLNDLVAWYQKNPNPKARESIILSIVHYFATARKFRRRFTWTRLDEYINEFVITHADNIIKVWDGTKGRFLSFAVSTFKFHMLSMDKAGNKFTNIKNGVRQWRWKKIYEKLEKLDKEIQKEYWVETLSLERLVEEYSFRDELPYTLTRDSDLSFFALEPVKDEYEDINDDFDYISFAFSEMESRYVRPQCEHSAHCDELYLLEVEAVETADFHVSYTESLAIDIQRSLAVLTERQRDILLFYFGFKSWDGEGCSLDDISNEFGLTRERVRQIKDKAINLLRATPQSQLLKKFLGQNKNRIECRN